MKNGFLAIAALALFAGSANAGVAAFWNFNADNLVATGDNAATASAALIGGTTSTFAAGAPADSLSVPNRGWNTTGYSNVVANSGTAGVRFNVSTVGFSDIVISYQHRHSNTASRFNAFQYTLDGSAATPVWVTASVFEATAGDTWFARSVDLSTVSGANENANFAFRIVSVVSPTTGAYVGSQTGSNFASTGTNRFDLVQVVPAPGAIALFGMGSLMIARRRRA